MDLENFPTREIAREMMSFISPIYDESYVGKWIFEVMAIYLELASDTIKGLKDEISPETATWTLPYWEQEYGIETDESLTIEERRAEIIKKRNFHAPMNPARIAQLVSDICGRESIVVENTAPHTYDVNIYPGDSNVIYDDVIDLIYEIKQSQKHVNIIFLNPIGLEIRASPKRLAFSYRLTSEHTMTGRWPDPAYSGKTERAEIDIAPDSMNQAFPYIITGTKPDINTIGQHETVNIEASADGQNQVYPYIITGTVPDVNTIGAADSPGIDANVSGGYAGIVYKICGAARL